MSSIKVGQTTMKDLSIPTTVILDKMLMPEAGNTKLVYERFNVVEVDGLCLVIIDEIFDSGPKKRHFKAFPCKEDALDYLCELGVIERDSVSSAN